MAGTQTDQAPSVSSVKSYYTAGTGISLSSGTIASTITQYTDTLAKSAAVVNSMAGSETNQAPSVSSVKSYYTAGTGISITSGTIASTITQYTNEDAQDQAASIFTGGIHTGISYSYVDGADRIDSTVSLSGFSIDALSDVDTSTTAPTDGQALAWQTSSSKWIPQTISGGGSSFTTWGTAVSANNTVLTLTVSNTAYLVNNSTNAWTVYLPAISACNGMRIIIKRMGTGLVTLSRNASDSSVFIDYAGQTSIDLGVQYSTFELIANTSAGAWYLV
jgi:hypothetical protein